MNPSYMEIIERLRCPKNDEEYCGYVGCHGMTCESCIEMTMQQAAKAIETLMDCKEKSHAHAIIDWIGNCKCSNCATSIDITGKYCHFCGARLDEPEQYES